MLSPSTSSLTSSLINTHIFSKVCDNPIDKKDLRIGKRVLIRNKESHIWFHWECYFQKFPANSVDDWDGFDTLKEADKKRLRGKVTDAPDNGM